MPHFQGLLPTTKKFLLLAFLLVAFLPPFQRHWAGGWGVQRDPVTWLKAASCSWPGVWASEGPQVVVTLTQVQSPGRHLADPVCLRPLPGPEPTCLLGGHIPPSVTRARQASGPAQIHTSRPECCPECPWRTGVLGRSWGAAEA